MMWPYPDPWRLAGAYLIIINVATFALFGADKLLAKGHRRRVPEACLLLLAVAGGSLGGWLAMYIFRHKTRHKKFSWGLPLILFMQIIAVVYFGIRLGYLRL